MPAPLTDPCYGQEPLLGIVCPYPERVNELIDSRNRWAACQIAGVDPKFTTLNGQDPVAYILSSNVARRHMNAGQRAMVAARVKLLNNLEAMTTAEREEIAAIAQVSASRIAQARMVLAYRPDLADDVISGSLPCPDRPFVADLVVRNAQGTAVCTTSSGEDGRFQVGLPPGAYELDPQSGAPGGLPSAPPRSRPLPPSARTATARTRHCPETLRPGSTPSRTQRQARFLGMPNCRAASRTDSSLISHDRCHSCHQWCPRENSAGSEKLLDPLFDLRPWTARSWPY